jgi:hypothetical protein
MKFKVINKFVDFLGNDILTIGQIIEPNSEGVYEISYGEGITKKYLNLSLEEVKNAKQNKDVFIFKEIDEIDEIDIIIEELPDDDDILVRNWRIQLDVKTTRKKLKEFEKIFRESIISIN